ncbi:hypothetical protein PR048_009463 [Dryococelus australis]|uniref:PiggyBac transposable element-derived protein domain-containing protein n=1 Tax=Dryococelus australis TaxID=614101 RepID=A0ABQ9I1T0_9NEOP|nr:hypothetical protein PR048_009463 [Dryococelus australis]
MNCFLINLFTFVTLLNKLKELGIFVSGTIRINRLGGADSKLTSITELRKRPCGIHVAGVVPLGNTRRWNMNKEYKVIPRPYSIEVYNKHMGGVDLIDSLVGLYRHTARDQRWYMCIFYHFLQVAVVNCWLLWRMNNEGKIEFARI